VGGRREYSGYFIWWRLRPTPGRLAGARRVAARGGGGHGQGFVYILRDLAEEGSDAEAKPLRRAAGAVGGFAGQVVFDVAKGELRRAGGDLAT
jgi:hypothetical protein